MCWSKQAKLLWHANHANDFPHVIKRLPNYFMLILCTEIPDRKYWQNLKNHVRECQPSKQRRVCMVFLQVSCCVAAVGLIVWTGGSFSSRSLQFRLWIWFSAPVFPFHFFSFLVFTNRHHTPANSGMSIQRTTSCGSLLPAINEEFRKLGHAQERILAEYIWIGGTGLDLRSKT